MGANWTDNLTPMQKRVAVDALSKSFVELLKLSGVGIFHSRVDTAALRVQELLKEAVESI